jgi:hypothetical protein
MDNKQIIYIDESGIHKTSEHSSFAFIYVFINDKNIIQEKIIEIEKSLNINYFHWSDFSTKHGWEIRTKFIKQVSKLPFRFKYFIIKNPINLNIELQNLLFSLIGKDNINEIIMDGKQPKWFERKIKKNLRDRGLTIKNFVTKNDKSEPIIRLADAISNLVRIYYDKPNKLIIELFNSINKKNINKTIRNKADGQDYR